MVTFELYTERTSVRVTVVHDRVNEPVASDGEFQAKTPFNKVFNERSAFDVLIQIRKRNQDSECGMQKNKLHQTRTGTNDLHICKTNTNVLIG